MAEKRVEESSDSEDYLSADEGLGNSRGSEGRAKVEGKPDKTVRRRDSGKEEVENERGEEEDVRNADKEQPTKEFETLSEIVLETKIEEQKSSDVEDVVESRDCEKGEITECVEAELRKEEVGRSREGEEEEEREGGEGKPAGGKEEVGRSREGEEEEEREGGEGKPAGGKEEVREEGERKGGESEEQGVKENKVVSREEVEKEEEKTPIPPPRRKRKKKLQKNPSLENLEKSLGDVRTQRSMTVGSLDMTRERLATSPHVPSLPPPHPSPSPSSVTTDTTMTTTTAVTPDTKSPDSADPGVRGAEISPPSPRAAKSHPTRPQGVKNDRHPEAKNVPSISIEPDTSLELTEEMVHGQSKVMTRDTPLAKAYGSDRHEAGIIFDTDDESEGEGVYGSQELPLLTDHSDYGPESETNRESGGSSVVVRGGGEGGREGGSERGQPHKEKTPVTGEDEEEEEEGEEEGERTRSPSDNQILQMTIVKNLDTGDSFPLSVVDEKIPLRNPLNQHLYRRTAAAMECPGDEGSGDEGHHRRRPQIRKKLRHFWGKKRTKGHGEGVGGRGREGGETIPRSNVSGAQDHDTTIKYKPSSHHKGPYEFDTVRLKQDLTGPHLGAVWVMEFSICGRLLAVAGQDSIVRVWVLRTAAQFFHELQAKYQRFGVHSSGESLAEKASMASTTSSEEDDANSTRGPFLEQPICTYHGHSADVLDISWSKNFFLLSSSMDKTVRLWHISRKECLCCFQHVDFVTAIAFHPRDDRYFLSGSLDGKLRLWNIPDKRVALWNEIEGVGSHLITAANFCMNGKLAVAGTYDGRCIFYETEHLKYHTQIHVKSRHGKNRGRKVSGIEPLPGEEKILVTTNDSRLRLYNLKDHSLSCKYKGGLNTSSQIRATFSRDGLSIISGSEDHFIYVWKTHHDFNKLSSVRRDRNEFYESFTTHHAPVTAAVFAPVPGITVDQGLKEVGQMIVAADYQGGIKVYVNSENL